MLSCKMRMISINACCGESIHQEVPPATTVPRNVECADAVHDLVSGLRPHRVGTTGKFPDRPNKGVPIGQGLPCTEILGGPFQNIGEIELCGSAQANAPSALDHEVPI
jgi:hypothetical protein